MLFAVEAFRRGGWETVWDAHRNPPETAWALLYPAAYFDDGFTVERPPAHDDPPDGLVRDTTLHPGIAPLYVLLRALGAVDPQDPAAELGAELQAETGREWAFGAAILRGWRGGRLSLYADRQAYRWDTTWADADAAGDVATAIRKAYREAYDGEDGVWEVGEAVVTVGRDGSMVRQTLGRTHEEAVALRDEA